MCGCRPFEALSEIETSSRLVIDHGVIYLSTPVVAQGDTPDAYLTPLGFVLTEEYRCHNSFRGTHGLRAGYRQDQSRRDLVLQRGHFHDLLEASRRPRCGCVGAPRFGTGQGLKIGLPRRSDQTPAHSPVESDRFAGFSAPSASLAIDCRWRAMLLHGLGRIAQFVDQPATRLDHAGIRYASAAQCPRISCH